MAADLRGLLLLAVATGCAGSLRIAHPEWSVEVRPNGSSAHLELSAARGFHVNPDYPLNFRGAGAQVERSAFVVEHTRAYAQIPRTAGVFAFSVCDPERCLIEKVPVHL